MTCEENTWCRIHLGETLLGKGWKGRGGEEPRLTLGPWEMYWRDIYDGPSFRNAPGGFGPDCEESWPDDHIAWHGQWPSVRLIKFLASQVVSREMLGRRARHWYRGYLKTPHWQRQRKKAGASSRWHCERCGDGGRMMNVKIHIHHKTYERLGGEWARDLEALCGDCHKMAHHKGGAKSFTQSVLDCDVGWRADGEYRIETLAKAVGGPLSEHWYKYWWQRLSAADTFDDYFAQVAAGTW